jgi:hypothetical protein
MTPLRPEPTPARRAAAFGSEPPTYRDWTWERYRQAVGGLLRLRSAYLLVIGLAWVLIALVFWYGYTWTANSSLWWTTSPGFWWVPIAWMASVPSFLIAGWGYFVGSPRTLLFLPVSPVTRKTSDVVFQVTTLGNAPNTVANTVASVNYWLGQHPEVSFRAHLWVVVEQNGYAAHRAAFDAMEARILVVPSHYLTPNHTARKARAMFYATQMRRTVFSDLTKTWVYHHDDETALGEDVILGIEEFTRAYVGERAIGYGVILYDQNFSWRPAQIQELTRTSADLSNLTFLRYRTNMIGMYHGSHYLARADVEDDFGWDVGPGPGSMAEDLLFDIGIRQLGTTFHMLHGFAHEQAALTVPDQLKQRRRWVQSALSVYTGYRLPAARRFLSVYFFCLWFIGGATIPLMAFTLWFHIGTFVAATFMGFMWASMLTAYHRAWMLHRPYVETRWTASAITKGVVGALVDGFAPWYAVFSKQRKSFDVVRKDVVGGTSERG